MSRPKGFKHTTETKMKIGARHKNKSISRTSILKMVATRKLKNNYKHTDETKTKLSVSLQGKKKSEETRRKIRNEK